MAREGYLTGSVWDPRNATWWDTVGYAENGLDILSRVHNDYVDNPALYKNHSTYDCLNQYMDPFQWRPSYLIMMSSDIGVGFPPLNSSLFLKAGIKESGPSTEPHFLCDSDEEMIKKCSMLNTLTPEDTGPINFDGITVDYCLYKATDSTEPMVEACHFQCSPQLLLGRFCVGLSKLGGLFR